MICISINQSSRRLALVDMHNAAPQGDLLEIRLDRFEHAPELGQLIAAKPKPVIISCRRPRDGGQWQGTEAERLALLRQAIVSKADYVEIELDVADQIRRFPPSQRVISYTAQPGETAEDLAERYAEALTKSPDVVKLAAPVRTPEEAWPLVQLLGRPRLPTVAVGLGRPGVMLSVLGRKIGAPWTYAALEKGMEAYPGQPTVAELRDGYHYYQIEPHTRLVGVTGFGAREYGLAVLVNAALAHLQLPARCLPLGVGAVRLFRKIVEAIKLPAIFVAPEHQELLGEMVEQGHGLAATARVADLLLHKEGRWHGYQVSAAVVLRALRARLQEKSAAGEPLRQRTVVLAGLGGWTRALGQELQRQGAAVILASTQRRAAQQLAQELGCRHISLEALYTTLHDVLLVCAAEQEPGGKIHPGYLREGMVVGDLTATWEPTPLLMEAQVRGCLTLEARSLFVAQVQALVQALTGKAVSGEPLRAALRTLGVEEEG